jgi:hypothetical protein
VRAAPVEAADEDAQANVPPDVTVWWDALQPGVVLLEHKTKNPIAGVIPFVHVEAIVSLQTGDKRAPAVRLMRDLSYYISLVVDQFRGFFK